MFLPWEQLPLEVFPNARKVLNFGGCEDFQDRTTKIQILITWKQVYQRRYESRRSSKPKLYWKQKNKIWRKTIFNMADRIITPCNVVRSWHWFRQVTAPCNVACGSRIVTVNSPSSSTLQCDMWLCDDMPLNSLKRLPYWNSTSGFDFDQLPQLKCHSAPVSEITAKSDHPRQNDVMTIFKMADLSHLGF